MQLSIFFYKVKKRLKKYYRLSFFRAWTKNEAPGLQILGDVEIMNRNITVGKKLTLYPGVMIFGDGPVEIGDNVNIGKDTILYASKEGGGIKIGSNSLIAAQCYIIDMDHGVKKNIEIRNQKNTIAPVVIGDDVWISANVTVLKGSFIHSGAIIGAKALVKGDVPKNSISVGVPAKVIKYRE